MRCTKCGAPRVPGTTRCWACKTALDKECPSSGEQADLGGIPDAAGGKQRGAELGAPDVAAPLAMAGANKRCHLCGADCIPDLPQCWNCGASLIALEQGEAAVGNEAPSPPWLRETRPAESEHSEYLDVTLPNFGRPEATTPGAHETALDRALDAVREGELDPDRTATNYVPPWVRQTAAPAPSSNTETRGLERPAAKPPPAMAQGPAEAPPERPQTHKTKAQRPSAPEPLHVPQPHTGGRHPAGLGKPEWPGAAGDDLTPPERPITKPLQQRAEPEAPPEARHARRTTGERVEPVVGTAPDADREFEEGPRPRRERPQASRKVSIWVGGAAAALLGAGIALAWVFFLPGVRGYFAQSAPRLAEGRVATPDGAVERPELQVTELPSKAGPSQNPDTLAQTSNAPVKEKAPPPPTGVKPPPNALALERGTAANATALAAAPSGSRESLAPVDIARAGKKEPPAPIAVPSAAAPAATAPLRDGATLYRESCAACHESGVGNAPSLEDVSAWTDRLSRGRESLHASVIQGHRAMKSRAGKPPPRDDEIRRAVDYMSEQLIASSVARAGRKGFSIHYGPEATPPPADTGAPTAQAPTPGDWRAQLRAEISACDNSPDNFQQGKCIEMARWKYCAPSRWGRDPQCPMPTEPSGADDAR